MGLRFMVFGTGLFVLKVFSWQNMLLFESNSIEK